MANRSSYGTSYLKKNGLNGPSRILQGPNFEESGRSATDKTMQGHRRTLPVRAALPGTFKTVQTSQSCVLGKTTSGKEKKVQSSQRPLPGTSAVPGKDKQSGGMVSPSRPFRKGAILANMHVNLLYTTSLKMEKEVENQPEKVTAPDRNYMAIISELELEKKQLRDAVCSWLSELEEATEKRGQLMEHIGLLENLLADRDLELHHFKRYTVGLQKKVTELEKQLQALQDNQQVLSRRQETAGQAVAPQGNTSVLAAASGPAAAFSTAAVAPVAATATTAAEAPEQEGATSPAPPGSPSHATPARVSFSGAEAAAAECCGIGRSYVQAQPPSVDLPCTAGAKVNGVVRRGADTYEVMEELGRGLYGTVSMCRHVSSGAVLALKEYTLASDMAKACMLQEARVLRSLQGHPCILGFEGHVEVGDGDRCAALMEYCEGGTLAGWRVRARVWQDARSAILATGKIVYGVAAALMHCHAMDIVHSDVKADNIFITKKKKKKATMQMGTGEREEEEKGGHEQERRCSLGRAGNKSGGGGSGGGGCRSPSNGDESDDSAQADFDDIAPVDVRLGDFNLAEKLGSSDAVVRRGEEIRAFYFAPEACAGRGYGKPNDMFQLGVMICWLLLRKPPFASVADVLAGVRSDSWQALAEVDWRFEVLVDRLLSAEPWRRPTAREVLGCELLQDCVRHVPKELLPPVPKLLPLVPGPQVAASTARGAGSGGNFDTA